MTDPIKFVKEDVIQEALRLHDQVATTSQAVASSRREYTEANINHHKLGTAHERLTTSLYMAERGKLKIEDLTDPLTGEIVGERGRQAVESRIQGNPEWLESDRNLSVAWERLRNSEADNAIHSDNLRAIGIQARLISGVMGMLEKDE